MNYKKIILILLIVIVLLGVILFFVLNRTTSTTNLGQNPTGIIIPTREVPANTLDVVDIDPRDQSQNIALDKSITITFSQTFTQNDFVFSITPNTAHTQTIEDNKLIIKPTSNWETGTEYGYSINLDDNQKVRLYSFTTTGPTQEFLPDTQPEGLKELEEQSQLEDDPNLYVSNQTPYETGTFYVTSEYEPNPPAHFYLIVRLKDQTRGQDDFNVWLQTLNLTQDQINSLDVRFE